MELYQDNISPMWHGKNPVILAGMPVSVFVLFPYDISIPNKY